MGLSPLEPTQEQVDNALPSSTEINSYMFSSQTLEDLCTNAGAAVRGTITDRYNAVYGGDAYTVYTIQVAQAYFGGPPVEETVTMVMATLVSFAMPVMLAALMAFSVFMPMMIASIIGVMFQSAVKVRFHGRVHIATDTG